MIPIRDDNSCRRGAAVVTWLLILANILVFVFIQGFGIDEQATLSLALYPDTLAQGRRWLALITAQFAHGSLGHLAGNMLYLGIFGDNIECRIGKLKYLALYLGSGILGLLLHTVSCLLNGLGSLPLIGASAAVSGILGAYLALFPGNRVMVLLFSFIPSSFSAWIVIGLWFIAQIFGSLEGIQEGGVAYLAHLGGFIAAWLWARSYKRQEAQRLRHSKQARWWIVP